MLDFINSFKNDSIFDCIDWNEEFGTNYINNNNMDSLEIEKRLKWLNKSLDALIYGNKIHIDIQMEQNGKPIEFEIGKTEITINDIDNSANKEFVKKACEVAEKSNDKIIFKQIKF